MTHLIHGTTPSGEYDFLCEFDAQVDWEMQSVTRVVRQTNGPPISAGEDIAELMASEPWETEGVGEITPTYTGLAVYWDDADRLHQGCAPESQRVLAGPGIAAPEPRDDGMEPQVEGREITIIEWDGIAPDGSPAFGTVICEFDAAVDVEGRVVTNVSRQGRGAPILTGEEIANTYIDPPRRGVEAPEWGPLGPIFGEEQVYRGADGRLYRGCAPESVRD